MVSKSEGKMSQHWSFVDGTIVSPKCVGVWTRILVPTLTTHSETGPGTFGRTVEGSRES